MRGGRGVVGGPLTILQNIQAAAMVGRWVGGADGEDGENWGG